MVMPLGQGAGALLLVMLKGVALPWLLPALGLLITVAFIFYSYKQNMAYGEALLDLLKEDRIHLLDLEDDDIRQLDSAAVAAISGRLKSDQDEVTLAVIELLRTVGSPQARTALLLHLPFPSPRATATALQALAAMGGEDTDTCLRPYLDAPEPQVRMAALEGLLQLGDATVQQHAVRLLDDPDVEVRAAALRVVLAEPQSPDSARAQQYWEAMLDTPDAATQIAALSIMAEVPETPLQGRVYRALDHADVEVRHAALRVLQKLATAGRVTSLDSALLRTLESDDVESRDLALQVLTALGTDEALEHMLVLLDDEQPQVRETLIRSMKRYGKRAVEPLFNRLQASHTSLLAKETALLALARLDSVRAEQFLAFWEGELRDVYRYKLMLASLEASPPLDADTFLRVALDNAHRQILSLLVQLLAVWASPDVARLVESGLQDPDRRKRASALEALESLSERRFNRLFLPILEAGDSQQEDWREVARRQWSLTTTDISTLLAMCLQDTNKWVAIGAVLSGQARASMLGKAWTEQLQQLADASTDSDVLNTVGHALGMETFESHRVLSLPDIILLLKRIPLFSSMTLDQLCTIAASMTVRDMSPGEIIFHEGDTSQELYVIVSGKVDIVQHFGATPRTLATMQAGEFLGELANFEARPRSADAVGAEQGILFVLGPERFRQIVLQDPAISFEIFRVLSARIRRFDEEAMEAARSLEAH
jgi:HEAT repeat protein